MGSRYIGVDVGERRVGLAVSDDSGRMALPHDTVTPQDAPARIVVLAAEIEAEAVVVGWPLNMDGTEGRATRTVQRFIDRVDMAMAQAGVELPVERWDERLTTTAAENLLLESDMSRRRRKKVIDQVAATQILQGYLDSLRHRRERDGEGHDEG